MDPTAEKLVEELQRLEQEQWRIAHRITAVRTAISLAGVTVPPTPEADENENRYARSHLFAGKALTNSCERIVKDHRSEWVGKRRVAYLLERGGYVCKGNLVNAVECTLRHLASRGRIEARRQRGREGNQYRAVPANSGAVQRDSEIATDAAHQGPDSRTASQQDQRRGQ
jgi:hypothetical protein